jgi:hypothetical protein
VESQPKISTTSYASCELHKFGTGLEINIRKREIIKKPLENKSMCHLRIINFWKHKVTRKRNAQKPKNSDRWVVARH